MKKIIALLSFISFILEFLDFHKQLFYFQLDLYYTCILKGKFFFSFEISTITFFSFDQYFMGFIYHLKSEQKHCEVKYPENIHFHCAVTLYIPSTPPRS